MKLAKNHTEKELITIQRQEIIQDIRIFTAQPIAKFYDDLFLNLDLSMIPEYPKTGRKGYSAHAMICAFLVMKGEGLSMITDLLDYLSNNLIIAHFCGFDIRKPLPSYWSFDRFLRQFDHALLVQIMKSQVCCLAERGLVDTSFIGLDSTPIFANTVKNNPKSFAQDRFNKEAPPKADNDCKLGVHSASNQANEKRAQFYWGYKNHVLVDCITGLPIFEQTTPANVADCSVAPPLLKQVHSFLPLTECSFLGDKGYDSKDIYDEVDQLYQGDCFIPLRTKCKTPKASLASGHPICEAELAMHKDGSSSALQKFCCPFKQATKDDSCPIGHPAFFNGKKNRGCSLYVPLSDNVRYSMDRESDLFKQTYSLRSECERYNSRFKGAGQERMWVRNQASVENLNTLVHIRLLAIAIACITTGKQSYRKLKSVKRIA